MISKNHSIHSLHQRIADLEKFKEEEVIPFIKQTDSNLKEVNLQINVLNEDVKDVQKTQKEQDRNLALFKEKIKQLESSFNKISFRDMFMIGLIVFLIMYILIKVII